MDVRQALLPLGGHPGAKDDVRVAGGRADELDGHLGTELDLDRLYRLDRLDRLHRLAG
jgi:hypothetical protein